MYIYLFIDRLFEYKYQSTANESLQDYKLFFTVCSSIICLYDKKMIFERQEKVSVCAICCLKLKPMYLNFLIKFINHFPIIPELEKYSFKKFSWRLPLLCF